ncbi:MAG: hypothetical protein ACON30_04290 [Flavobacteriaceae bacterium]
MALIFSLILSCTKQDDEVIQSNSLNDILQIDTNNLSDEQVANIKKTTTPIYFDNIKDAKKFIEITSENFVKSVIKGSKNYMYGIDPCNNQGSATLTTGNMSMFLNLNVTFNYNGTEISDINSNMSGFTLGLSYEHTSSNTSVSGNTVNFNVQGVMSYNLFVNGIGTVFQQNVTLTGNFNPCTGSGEVKRCPPSECAFNE